MNDQTPNQLDIIAKALHELTENKTSNDVVFSNMRFVEFKATKKETNYGKGLIFSGQGHTKQLVFNANPDQFFSSENVNLDKDRSYLIGGISVLNSKELGPTVTKSSIKEVGRLRGLIVDGSVNFNDYMFYNGTADRLGLGTDAPNAALSIAEGGIEVMVGTDFDTGGGLVGTHASHDLDIVTDSTSRISVKANGNIELGNPTKNPVQVTVHGKLSVGVKVPDPAVDLHVAGSIRFGGHVHMYASTTPNEGNYTVGDIIWNSTPRVGTGVGWICLRAGNPGVWHPFGEVRERGN